MSLCEYDPDERKPATALPESNGFGGVTLKYVSGCRNQATVSVGAEGRWHLCKTCAALPEFSKYRKRTPLKPVRTSAPRQGDRTAHHNEQTVLKQ